MDYGQACRQTSFIGLRKGCPSPARDKADFTPRAAGSPDQSRARVAPESTSLPTRAGPWPAQRQLTPKDRAASPETQCEPERGSQEFPGAVQHPPQKQAIETVFPRPLATPLFAARLAPYEFPTRAAACSRNTPPCRKSR